MRVIIAGWNENAFESIRAVVDSKHKVVCVATPEGYLCNEIETLCKKKRVPHSTVKESSQLTKLIARHSADILVLASWPKILRQDVFDYPKYKTINVHGSFLPMNRGQHPINWAIIRSEKETGVTVHYVDTGIDSGDIILQKKVPIHAQDTVNTLRRKIVKSSGPLLVRALDLIDKGDAHPKKQAHFLATYAPKRIPEDGKINWEWSSHDISNLIRALESPYPNAFCNKKNGEKVLIKKAYVPKKPGKVLFKTEKYFGVATGDGVVLVESDSLEVGDTLS